MANNLGVSSYTLGGDFDTWGAKYIADMAIFNKFAGDTYLTTSTGGTLVLTSVDTQNFSIQANGGTSVQLDIRVPDGIARFWYARNDRATGAMTVRCAAGGSAVTLNPGDRRLVYSDGTNCVDLTLTTISIASVLNLQATLDGKLPLAGGTMTGPIVLAADPTLAMHPTTKQYVDAIFQGVNWKAAVRAATVAAGTLATSFANGQTVDGVVLATGDRILVKNQVSGPENGIYTVNAFGAPTRATDADTGAEIKDSTVAVGEGTANADSLWKMTNDGAITLGSTALVFVNISVASIPASYLDTDGTLAANSDTRVPSQKAVVSYAARKGTGSGRKLFTLYPENNQFFGTNYAALDLRNSHPISVFPDGVVAVYVGSGELPEDYVGGNGIIVDVDWMDDGVGTQKACFGVQIERMDVGTTDFDADSFASQVVDTTGVAASSTSGVQSKSSIAVPAANMDGAVAGDQIRVKITRETGQGNDTNTGSVQATRFKVREA